MWIFLGTLTYLLFWLTCIVSYTIHYLTSVIQITSFSQVIYTLNAGAEGAQGTIGTAVGGFFAMYWPLLVLGTILYGVFLYVCLRRHKAKKAGQPFFTSKKMGTVFNCSAIGALLITGCTLGARTAQGYSVLGIGEYMKNVNRVTDLYENSFVESNTVTLDFPEKKKNLIYIVVESLESTYTDQEHGGGYPEDLMPNLYQLAKEGTDFSPAGTKELNGAYVASNTGWTVAGLVAQSSGTPLNVGNGDFCRNFQSDDQFMPHLTTLGDILKEAGYHNYFMCGSDAAYAGRANYYRQHGDYEILDWGTAKNSGFIPKDYAVWWGFEDLKLFDWAKQKLPEIAKNDQPFNFTMLTADTHFEDGYLCPECEDEFDSQYENVIACSDRQISKFVRWVQEQDFYKDTTIVIAGDHLSMDGSVPQTAGPDYDRKSFAIVLNGPRYELETQRSFTTLDLFPTILESLGVQIEGHRLGLGTSLYSDEPTLAEALGIMELNAELTAESVYYTNVIMSGDQTRRNSNKNPDSPDEPVNEEPVNITPPSAQQYIENQEQFSDPNFVYTPPVQDYNPGYDPGYGQGTYVPPVSEQPTPPAPEPPASAQPTPSAPQPPASEQPTPPAPQPPVSELPGDPNPGGNGGGNSGSETPGGNTGTENPGGSGSTTGGTTGQDAPAAAQGSLQ